MGGKSSTTTQSVKIPKEVMERYNAVNTRAENVAQNPFQQFGTDPSAFVAQINAQQQGGINAVNAAAGSYAPYYDAATAAGTAGMGSAMPQELDINRYMNPYQQQVIDATMRQMGQANEQAQSGALGQAASSGAFGGDRAGIAAANLANQQGLSMGSTLAGLNAQNYGQALSTAQQQQGLYLGATQADLERLMQGGQFLAGLGTARQQAGLQGAEAMLNAGTLQQQTEQAGKTAMYNQFQQEQAYPFQVAQFLANIAMGTGALSGSTTTTTQPSSWFSDRRLKEDIRRIGHTDDGMPIYKYKYKGDENHQTHIGFMADEVEQVKPEAVGVSGGYKTVDYDRATKAGGGGVAGPYSVQAGSDNPYAAGYVPQAYLPVGQLMLPDSGLLDQSNQSAAAQLEAAASFGDNLVKLRDTFGPDGDIYKSRAQREAAEATGTKTDPSVNTTQPETTTVVRRPDQWRGGVAGYADGGPAYLKQGVAGAKNPVSGKGYVADTLVTQEKQKPELMQPGSAPQSRSTMDDISSMASAAASIASLASLSDRRTKHSIRRIGRTDHGMPIYSFKYKGDDREQTHIGFMADEVEEKHPDAVMTGHDGYKRVDYGQAHKFYQGGVVRSGYEPGGAVPQEDANDRPMTAAELMAAAAEASMPAQARAELNATAERPAPPRPAPPQPAPEAGLAAAAADPARLSFSPSVAPTGGVAGTTGVSERPVAAPVFGGVQPLTERGAFTPVAAEYPVNQPIAPAAPATPQGGVAAGNVDQPLDMGVAVRAPASGGVRGAGENDMNAARDFYRNSIIRQESGGRQFDANGNPLTSSAGAVGVGQVMEGTGPEAAAMAGLPWDRDRWLNDPEYNAAIGEAYFLEQYRRFGSLDKAAAAYNAGPGALSSALDRATGLGGSYLDYLPEETQKYVASTTGIGGGRMAISSSGTPSGGVNPDGYGIGGDKPWGDRTTVGKMFYDRDGRVNKDALLSILGGIGTMASSPSRYLGSAILQGIGGAANTYMAQEARRQDITSSSITNADQFQRNYLRAVDGFGYRGTPEDYAREIGYTGPLSLTGGIVGPDGTTISSGVGSRTYKGAVLDPFGRGMTQTIELPGVGRVQAGQTYGYLKMLEAEMERAQKLGITVDPQALADLRAKIATHTGQLQTEDGVFTDPTYMEAQFGQGAGIRDVAQSNEIALTIGDDLTASREMVRNTDELAKALEMMPSTGSLSPWYGGVENVAGQLGLTDDMDYATALDIAGKSIAEMARGAVTNLAGTADTAMVRELVERSTPSGTMTPKAIEELLAIRAGIAAYNEAFQQATANALASDPAANVAEVQRRFALENKPLDFIEEKRPQYKGMFVPPRAAAAGITQEEWSRLSQDEKSQFLTAE